LAEGWKGVGVVQAARASNDAATARCLIVMFVLLPLGQTNVTRPSSPPLLKSLSFSK
jgi:hypothetical protein